MIIGYDLDGVLAMSTERFLSWMADKYKRPKVKFSSCKNWDLSDVLEMDSDEINTNYDLFFRLRSDEIDHYPNADSVVRKLRDAGHTLYIMTARNKQACFPQTLDWIDSNFQNNFDDVLFIPSEQKAKEAFNLQTDIFIDDNPKTIDAMVAFGIRGILFNQPYNAASQAERIFSHNDIYGVLKHGRH